MANRSRGRSLRVEQLECRRLLDGASLANDAFDVNQNGPQMSLDVLANDVFDDDYAGARRITSISFGSQGGRIEIADDNDGGGGQRIDYTAPADFFGTETFVYSVDSEFTATVSVTIRAPLAFDQYELPPDGLTRTLDVLANDPFWDGYAGSRRITAVSVGSADGAVSIAPDGQSVEYTRPVGSHGKETFIYVVDDLYPAQVTIDTPRTLENDRYEFVQHDPPATLNVLANDPFWSGYDGPGYGGDRIITHVTESQLGATVEIAADGKSIVYQQPDEFTATWSTNDSFRYVVDGTYEAHISVYLHRPVRDDYFEVDENSSDFFYNVIQNDTYRDLNNVVRDVIDRVTGVTQSEQGGSVAVAAGGLGVLYTPPAGFIGSDTFTYTADGVHEASVSVSVTRPVRDDFFYQSAFQDTPNAVLTVLSNDFLGNGYAGPRLISDVGPTANGGEVEIRSDGGAILYTPAPGYTGSDSFTYTVDGELQAVATVSVRALAQGDSFYLCADPAHGAYVLNVLGNDHFDRGYAGPGEITDAEVIDGSGQLSISANSALLFTPEDAGYHQIRYTVDGQYEATVSISFRNHLVGDHEVVDQNSDGGEFFVLANDFPPDHYSRDCRNQDYPGPRLITGVTESEFGGVVTVAADGQSVHYTPAEDFVGQDSFTYTVDGLMQQTVTVEVIRRVRDDVFRVDAVDGQQALPVLVNDLFGADYAGVGQITGVTAANGTVEIAADGQSLLYTPADGFTGTDVFSYTVDGALIAEVSVVVDVTAADRLPTFDGIDDYREFLLDDALQRYQYLFGSPVWHYAGGPEFDDLGITSFGTAARNHSETNVQVAGVDEGDIVEFDSDYLYMLTDDGALILDAWPGEDLAVASSVEIEGRPTVEYLHGDRLTVISELGGGYGPTPLLDARGFVGDSIDGSYWYGPPLPSSTIVTVIDVSDRGAPTKLQTTTMEGRYIDSRGVGDYVYVLVSNDAVAPAPEVVEDPEYEFGRYETEDEYLARVAANPGVFVEEALPNYTTYGPDGELVRTGLLNMPEDVYEPIVPDGTNLITIASVNVESNEPGLADTSAVYSSGVSTIYASLENFYVFDGDYTREDGAITRIAKFDWDPDTGGIEFAAATAVPGTILNQFSADESADDEGNLNLRIATTVSNSNSGNWTGRDENTLFVLQDDDGVFEAVGSLQNLALNETMRSVRFLGDRAFVTTFRNVDPLFAVDLSDATNPRAVGHITLPGFTSYMHLVDQNHLLTVGRNTPGGTAGPTQVSLFDIADLTQPLRTAEYTFPRFSTSEAELDHHAFGYYAEHGLLGIPVAERYIERVDEDGDGYRETSRWVTTNALAVFSVDADAGQASARLALASEIEHDGPVRRSGYIGDKLFSVANDSVKVVDVAAPATVIAELVIEPFGEDPPTEVDVNGVVILADPRFSQVATDFPANQLDEALLATVDRARADLANREGVASEAPLLVSVEAAPAIEGGGLKLVLQVGENLFAYRSNDDGYVQLVSTGFSFATENAAWHSASSVIAAPPVTPPGDYDVDGRVGGSDFLAWQRAVGTTDRRAADGNDDQAVDAQDLNIWEQAFAGTATQSAAGGDYDNDGRVGGSDFLVWQRSLGATTTGAAADGNRDGAVDRDDLQVWQRHFAEAPAAAVAVPGDYDPDAQVRGSDFLAWQLGAGSADGNRDGAVDSADLAIWSAHYGYGAAAVENAEADLQEAAVDAAILLTARQAPPRRDDWHLEEDELAARDVDEFFALHDRELTSTVDEFANVETLLSARS